LNRLKEFFRKLLMSLHTRDLERGGWLSRYGFPISIFYFLNVLALYAILYRNITPAQYLPYFIVIFVAIQLTLGSIMVASVVKVLGNFFLAIFVAIVVLVASWWLIINRWSP